MILLTAILSALGVVLYMIKSEQANKFASLLLFFATLVFVKDEIVPEESEWGLIGLLTAVVSIQFLLSTFIRNRYLANIFPFAGVGILYFFTNAEWAYTIYSLDFSQFTVILLPVLGIVAMLLIDLFHFLFSKWIPEVEDNKLESAVGLIALGLFTIVAHFFASWFGSILLAFGAYSYATYCYSSSKMRFVVALLLFGSIGTITATYSVEAIDLTIGKVLAGLILGAGVVALFVFSEKIANRFKALALIILGVGILILVLKLNQIHPAYGGIDAFLAAWIGSAVALMVINSERSAILLFPVLLLLSLTLPSNPFAELEVEEAVSEQSDASTKKKKSEKKAIDFAAIAGKDLQDAVGEYAFDETTSEIQFHLGPKGGVTKGAIRNFTGSVHIAEKVENSTFSVELPIKNLTTFNSMRDESLMEKAYFDAENFPVMQFQSNKLIAKDGVYELDGKFTMLGNTQPEKVIIKVKEFDHNSFVLIGRGTIDKTKYGMESSPQEGDVVDFQLEVVLRRTEK